MRDQVLLLTAVLTMLAGAGADVSAQQLYWSQFGASPRVGRVNLDGSGSVTVAQSGQVFGMDGDAAARRVYWINNDALTIQRANFDFSNQTTLVSGLISGFNLNLAIDPAHDLLFWTNSGQDLIEAARLSDGQIVSGFQPALSGQSPDDIALDPIHSKVYWTNQTGELERADYNGNAQEVVGSGLVPGAYCGGVALDLAAGKVYFDETNEHQILRANLDGTGRETLLTLDASERPFGLDLFGGRMYWADRDGGRLRSARIDGSDVQTLLSGLSNPRAVSIVLPEPSVAVVTPPLLLLLLLLLLRRRSRALRV